MWGSEIVGIFAPSTIHGEASVAVMLAHPMAVYAVVQADARAGLQLCISAAEFLWELGQRWMLERRPSIHRSAMPSCFFACTAVRCTTRAGQAHQACAGVWLHYSISGLGRRAT